MENAIVLGSGEVAVALASERDPARVRWWVARVDGAIEIENKRNTPKEGGG